MVFTKAQAKSLAILDVARSLGMEMKRNSHKEYYWAEHDSFKIDVFKNTWHWYSKGLFGDTINLVQEMRNVSYKDAMTFLETGNFPEASPLQEERQPFVYRLQQSEKPFREARDYLKEQRGLSDETIDFFLSKGVLAQARYQAKDGYQEDVLVFKYFNQHGQIVGASLQGLAPNKERYEGKGYLKQTLYGAEGIAGLNVSIGTPERLVVAEAPIDLMSYYELHKGGLEDVRLVAMEGLKEGVLSRYSLELLQERGLLEQEYRDYTKASDLAATSRFLSLAAQRSTFFQDHPLDDFITLAVDNDKAGTDFLENLREKNIPIIDARPPKGDSEEKIDWNAYLKEQKGGNIMENTYQKQVDDLISDMTKDDTNYYLWHDEELNTMDAGDTILEEFHSGLEDVRYEIAGATLYVEESINDGATGYLSLEGHALDDSGIRDYLSDKGLSGAAAVEFLTKLKVELSEIWNKVVNHYNKQLEKIIEKYGLTPEITSGVKEKALDRNQELYSNAGDSHRNPDFLGESSPGAASKPVVDEPQPDFPVIAPLQFTTKGEWMSTLKPGYHVITDGELKRLNKFAPGLQATAQWYLKELSGGTITYLYQDREGMGRLDVQFSDENFAHLTGISPKGVEMKQVVYDFASGQGDYGNIQVSHAIKDKSMVLPLLPDIISSQAFVFNDLSTVEKFHKIDLAQAIQTEDEDLLLALRDVDGIGIPASMMRIKDKLSVELAGKEKVILGVYRERSGHLEQLSINEEFVKDGGREMMSLLANEQYPKEFSEEKVDTMRGESISTDANLPKSWGELVEEEEVMPVTESKRPEDIFSLEALEHLQKFFRTRIADVKTTTTYDELGRELETYTLDGIAFTNHHVEAPAFSPDKQVQELIAYVANHHGQTIYSLKEGVTRIADDSYWLDVFGYNKQTNLSDYQSHPNYQAWDWGKTVKETPILRYTLYQNGMPIDFSSVNELVQYFKTHAPEMVVKEFEAMISEPGRGDAQDQLMVIDAISDSVSVDGVSIIDTLGKTNKEMTHFQEPIDLGKGVVDYEALRQQSESAIESKPYSQFKKDSDSDGISDEEELLQGTNPFDFRSQPGTKPTQEIEVQEDAAMMVAGTSVVAELIKNQDIVGLNRHLKEGIKDYLDSKKYKDYLTKMSQLNNYSSRNLRLILAQNPEATQVASFKQWKETFGRHVKKGEKSLRIFAPMTKIKKDDNNQPVLDKNGKPETVTFFGLVPVFDVSQTDGKEMPKAATVKEQLTDLDYANLYRALMTVAKANDVSVRFEEMADSRKGYYSVTENQIVLRSNDMNKSQIIKTFLHETAHSELHHADNPQQEQLTRSTAELQAESVAYVVASYYGIDTSEYSFDYLAGWSNDKETLADLEAQLDIVQQEAKSLIVRMDQTLEELRLAQTKKASQHFEQKLQKFKDKTDQVIAEQKQEQKVEQHAKKEQGFSK